MIYVSSAFTRLRSVVLNGVAMPARTPYSMILNSEKQEISGYLISGFMLTIIYNLHPSPWFILWI
jgi:hypothetical protein